MIFSVSSWRLLMAGLRLFACLLVCGCLLAPTAKGALTHKYDFNTDVAAGGTFQDLAGNADGTLMNGAVISGGALVLNGVGTGITGDHAQLLTSATDPTNGIDISSYTNATFAIWATSNGLADWQRYFDFGGKSIDNTANAGNSIWITPNAGGGDGIRFAISNVDINTQSGFNNEQNTSTTEAYPGTGQLHHIVGVFDGDNDVMRVYVDGLQRAQNTMATHELSMLQTDFALLGASLYDPDPSFNGTITEFKVFDNALSPSEVLQEFTNCYDGGVCGPAPVLTVDRDSGTMVLSNLGTPAQVVGYSITSASGGLNIANWQSIADNFDATSGGEFDDNDEWTKLSADDSKTDLSEFVFDTDPGDGGALSGGGFEPPLGAASTWRKSIYEDVEMELKYSDGTTAAVGVTYTGNGDAPFMRSDLNFDNSITIADYNIFLSKIGTVFTDMSAAETYPMGDLNGDLVNDRFDFRLFKTDYNTVNGAGAFEAMLASVPEPSTLAILLLGYVGLVPRRLRRSFVAVRNWPTVRPQRVTRPVLVALVVVAMIGALVTRADAAVKNRYSFTSDISDSVGGANGTVVDAGTTPNYTFGGGMIDLSANTGEGSNAITEDAYVDLPNGVFSSAVSSGTSGAVSLEFWATVTETHTWQRFGDFGTSNNGEDTSAAGDAAQYVLITPNSGRFGDGLEITNHPASNAAEPNVGTAGPFPTGTEAHVVAVYDHTNTSAGSNGTMSLYLDGALIGTNQIYFDVDLAAPTDNNNWLGRSQWNDPVFDGSYNEFRIWDTAMDESRVTNDFLLGPDADPNDTVVSLEVNKSTGAVKFVSNYDQPLAIDYYEVNSADGALDTDGWTSIDGETDPGEGWDQAGTADANQLIETFLPEAGGTLAAMGELTIGNAYNPAIFGDDDGDLTFGITLTSGAFLSGNVTYVSGPVLDGDYDNSGQVAQGDLDLVLLNWGKTVPPDPVPDGWINQQPSGLIGQGALDGVLLNWGDTAGSGVAVAVPEPATLLTLAGAALLGFWWTRRRSPRMLRLSMTLAAFVAAAILTASVNAGSPDRVYTFGEDPDELPTIGQPPNSTAGQLTLDSEHQDTSGFSDYSDLSYSGSPMYFDAGGGALARPGAAPGTFGLQFNGSSDYLYRPGDANVGDQGGGLGVPAQGDRLYATATGAPGYDSITTRYIQGWVRPTGGAGTRRDVINDTARFGIFIDASDNWSFVSGVTTVNSSTPATLNQWTHVEHRTFGSGGGAALYVDGIAVAATPNAYPTGDQAGPALNLVIGAGGGGLDLTMLTNFFSGQLDDFSVGVAGDNSGSTGGRDYGDFDLATDNEFVAQDLAGVNAADINRDTLVDDTDVGIFVTNWLREQQVDGVTVGDLNSRAFGDLNMNGVVDLDDAFTLHAGLLAAGVGSGLDFSLLGATVPEPSAIILLLGGLTVIACRRRR
jgi:hypothetical protein